MRYIALATDYYNTLAADGGVAGAALGRLRASGRRAFLVRGRSMEDLLRVCECSDLFDYMVENGPLLYERQSREITLLGEPPPEHFVAALRRRGVQPIELGNGHRCDACAA